MNTKQNVRPTSPSQSNRHTALVHVVLAALFALCASTVFAVNGRDFAGFYRYRLTADFQDTKQVTLTLQIFNYSGADVSGATVRIENLVTGATGSIAGVSINTGGSATVSGTFVIPAVEFARWQAGGSPRLAIEYTGADGSRVSQLVELAPWLAPAGGVQ